MSAELHIADGTSLHSGVASLAQSAGGAVRPLRASRKPLMSRAMSQMLNSLLLLAAVTVSYLVISNYFLQSVRVTGVSMEPALHNAQHCFLNRWIYLVRSPARGEVIVIRDPQDNGLAVKRIVGIPGDKVRIENGKVFVNDQLLREPYLNQGTPTFPGGNLQAQEFRCDVGQFVVLGDNRLNSTDSRTYGSVPKRNVLGLIIQ